MEKDQSEEPAHSEKDEDTNNRTTTTATIDGDDNCSGAECGIGRFRPAALRACATIPAFVGVYSFSALLTSTLNSYVNSQVTAFERHFGFSSFQSGLIVAANDIGFLTVVLFVSFIAAQTHIPRALCCFSILFGISGIMSALPYFLFGAPSPASSADVGSGNISSMTSAKPSASFSGQICDGVNDTSLQCNVTNTDASGMADNAAHANAGTALVIIMICMVLQGMAKSPRSSFTLTYVDANKEKVKTGFYLGIVVTAGVMGPALAFGLGGVFSRIYVTLEETDLHYRHPKWIGAWWLGFVVLGAGACVFSIPLLCFPRHTKEATKQEEKRPATRQADRVSSLRMVTTLIKGFLSAVVRLITNPVYICTVLSLCALMVTAAGSQAFTPKYIENQFSLPAWKANMAMAGMMLSTTCAGTFVGGYLTKRFKMGPMVSLKFVIIMHLAASTAGAILILFQCDQPYIYNSPGPRATKETNLAGCMDSCGCDDDDCFPVCGDDGRTFFSPCHAGCLHTVDEGYTNCTCITGGRAVAGMCDYGCDQFYPYMVFVCLTSMFFTFALIPQTLVFVRAVEERDKPLATGFMSFLGALTGWMLAPICFGKLIDTICIQWEPSCTGSGACRLYDNDVFRWKFQGVQIVFRFLSFLLIVIAFISAKVTKRFEKKEDSEAHGNLMAMTSTDQ